MDEEFEDEEIESEEEIAERERQERIQELEENINNYNNAIDEYTYQFNSSCETREKWEIFKRNIEEIIQKLNDTKEEENEANQQLTEAYMSVVAKRKSEELNNCKNQIQDIINKLYDPILTSINDKIDDLSNDVNRWEAEISSAQNVLNELEAELDTI